MAEKEKEQGEVSVVVQSIHSSTREHHQTPRGRRVVANRCRGMR